MRALQVNRRLVASVLLLAAAHGQSNAGFVIPLNVYDIPDTYTCIEEGFRRGPSGGGNGRSIVLECEFGQLIKDVGFASIGNPVGSCTGGYQGGPCSLDAGSIIMDECIGKEKCTFSQDVFSVLLRNSSSQGCDELGFKNWVLASRAICGSISTSTGSSTTTTTLTTTTTTTTTTTYIPGLCDSFAEPSMCGTRVTAGDCLLDDGPDGVGAYARHSCPVLCGTCSSTSTTTTETSTTSTTATETSSTTTSATSTTTTTTTYNPGCCGGFCEPTTCGAQIRKSDCEFSFAMETCPAMCGVCTSTITSSTVTVSSTTTTSTTITETITDTSTTTTSTTTLTTTTGTTTTYAPGNCGGVLEPTSCGTRFRPEDCWDETELGKEVLSQCPVMCSVCSTTSTTVTDTTTTGSDTTTTSTTTTASTTTTYFPSACDGTPESASCGSRIHIRDCELTSALGDFARDACPTMCGTCSTTTTTISSTTVSSTTTTLYNTSLCYGQPESAVCGKEVPMVNCDLDNDLGSFARTTCPVMCGVCSSTTTTSATTTTDDGITTTETSTSQTSTTATETTVTTSTSTTTTSTASSTTTTEDAVYAARTLQPDGLPILFSIILAVLWLASIIALLWSASTCGYARSTRTEALAQIRWERELAQAPQPQMMQYNSPQQQLANPSYDGNFVEWESVISGPPGAEMMQASPVRQFNLHQQPPQRVPSRGTVREVIVSDLHASEDSSSSSMSGDSWGGDGMYYNSNLDSALDQDVSTDSDD